MSPLSRRALLEGLALSTGALALGRPARAESPVILGMTTALSGPAGFLGRDMRDGVQAALHEHARRPGARPVTLRCLDDGYRQDVARTNMQALVDDPEVLAIIGNVGTPTAQETVPLAKEAGVVLFAPLTGAQDLRRPVDPHGGGLDNEWVFHIRPSYGQEVQVLAKALLSRGIRPQDLALFVQDDGYGEAVHGALVEALGASRVRYALPPEERQDRDSRTCEERLAVLPDTLLTTCYERNTTDVSEAVLAFHRRGRPPRAVIMAGTYLPCAKLIRMLRPQLPDTLFISVSFVGASQLVRALGDQAEGVLVTATVPPFDTGLPLVTDFSALPDAFFSDPAAQRHSPVALEGFLAGRALLGATDGFTEVHDRAEVRRRILAARLPAADTGMLVTMRFDDPAHQASSAVWTTVVRDGHLVQVDWDALLGAPL